MNQKNIKQLNTGLLLTIIALGTVNCAPHGNLAASKVGLIEPTLMSDTTDLLAQRILSDSQTNTNPKTDDNGSLLSSSGSGGNNNVNNNGGTQSQTQNRPIRKNQSCPTQARVPGEAMPLNSVIVKSLASLTIRGASVPRAFSSDFAGPFHYSTESSNARIQIPVGSVVALEFTTADSYRAGQMSRMLQYSTHPFSNGGRILYSISECPGQFDLEQTQASACQGNFGPVGGTIVAGIGSSYQCELETGKTYYINITGGFEYPLRSAPTGMTPYTAACVGQTCGGYGGSEHSFDFTPGVLIPETLNWTRFIDGRSSGVKVIGGMDSTYDDIARTGNAWYQNARQCMQNYAASIVAGGPRSGAAHCSTGFPFNFRF